MIDETISYFPEKEFAVNFNRRGFYPQNQGPNAIIPDEKLDYVAFDLYPCRFGINNSDESDWKNIIVETANQLKNKTSKPILYIAQGFSTDDCRLTPKNIIWSYESAVESDLTGIIFWFSESQSIQTIGDGFSSKGLEESKQTIIELGKIVIREK
jgi:hypothetical protein